MAVETRPEISAELPEIESPQVVVRGTGLRMVKDGVTYSFSTDPAHGGFDKFTSREPKDGIGILHEKMRPREVKEFLDLAQASLEVYILTLPEEFAKYSGLLDLAKEASEPIINSIRPPRSAVSLEALFFQISPEFGVFIEQIARLNLLSWETVTGNFRNLLLGRDNVIVKERRVMGEKEFDGVVYDTKTRELRVNNTVLATRTDYEEKDINGPLDWNQANFVPTHAYSVHGCFDNKTPFNLQVCEFAREGQRVRVFTYEFGDSKQITYCGGCPLPEATQRQIVQALSFR